MRLHNITALWSTDWVQVVGALINAVFLLALCFSIAVEAVERFLAPEPVSHWSL